MIKLFLVSDTNLRNFFTSETKLSDFNAPTVRKTTTDRYFGLLLDLIIRLKSGQIFHVLDTGILTIEYSEAE
jgi:hypothetical protein